MPGTRKPKTYEYVVALTTEWYPRHLADYMTMQSAFAQQLVHVQDLQRDDYTASGYVSGDTWMTGLTDPKNKECQFETSPDIEHKLLEQVIEMVRTRCFDADAEVTDAQCLGLAISHFFGVNQQGILKTCYNALEDANCHKANEAIEPCINA
jgi:hypothetical protein